MNTASVFVMGSTDAHYNTLIPDNTSPVIDMDENHAKTMPALPSGQISRILSSKPCLSRHPDKFQ
jgi:hypothetical protein